MRGLGTGTHTHASTLAPPAACQCVRLVGHSRSTLRRGPSRQLRAVARTADRRRALLCRTRIRTTLRATLRLYKMPASRRYKKKNEKRVDVRSMHTSQTFNFIRQGQEPCLCFHTGSQSLQTQGRRDTYRGDTGDASPRSKLRGCTCMRPLEPVLSPSAQSTA